MRSELIYRNAGNEENKVTLFTFRVILPVLVYIVILILLVRLMTLNLGQASVDSADGDQKVVTVSGMISETNEN